MTLEAAKPIIFGGPTMNPCEDLDKLLKECGVQVQFGLRAQGHIPTIQRMLSEGCSWQEIGRAIHWDPETARDWYERLEKPPEGQ